MDIIDTIKNKIYETAKTAAKKSNEVVEATKIRLALSDAEAKVAQLMKEMGEMLYDEYKNEAELEDAYLVKCSEIDEVFESIGDLKEKLSEVRDMKICPNCKKESEKDDVFCSKCGHKFE